MKHLLTSLPLVLSFFMSACVYGGPDQLSGVIKKQDHALDSFNSIHVKTGIQLFLSQGEELKATVEADEELIDRVVLKIEDGELKIHLENPLASNWFQWGKDQGAVKVYLTCGTLKSLDASSGAHVVTEDVLSADSFEMEASSGAHMKVNLNARDVELDASSGAHISLEGQADRIFAEASSGAHIKAADFIAQGGSGEASSGAQVTLFINGEADAEASSGGQVRILGDVRLKSIESSSGGSIRTR